MVVFVFFAILFALLAYGIKAIYDDFTTVDEGKMAKEENARMLKTKARSPLWAEDAIAKWIRSGGRYDDICKEFEEDFKFIFGASWKSRLKIPPLPGNYCFYTPGNHMYWVYRLILAARGKLDHSFFYGGYELGGTQTEVYIRFAQRIEHHLVKNGIDIRLVMEDTLTGKTIQAESLCRREYKRLWSSPEDRFWLSNSHRLQLP